jgi:hypothetical protein
MKKILVLISLVFFSAVTVFSQVSHFQSEIGNDLLKSQYQKKLELENKIIHNENRFSGKDSIDINNIDRKDNPNLKSTFLGGLFSGIIPGAGQFYAKSYIKSAAFLAVEVGLWVAYGIFQKKGNDQTDFYQNYASQNWNMRKYAQWLKTQGFSKSSDIDLSSPDEVLRSQINACEEINFSHTLPRYGEQQYYEVIGKYQNFLSGWSSANPDLITKNNYLNYKLSQVDYYMTERQNANDFYDRGSTMITVVIINHLLSAADGVWSVMRYNSRISVKSDVSVHSKYSYNLQKSVIVPQFNLSVNF